MRLSVLYGIESREGKVERRNSKRKLDHRSRHIPSYMLAAALEGPAVSSHRPTDGFLSRSGTYKYNIRGLSRPKSDISLNSVCSLFFMAPFFEG